MILCNHCGKYIDPHTENNEPVIGNFYRYVQKNIEADGGKLYTVVAIETIEAMRDKLKLLGVDTYTEFGIR